MADYQETPVERLVQKRVEWAGSGSYLPHRGYFLFSELTNIVTAAQRAADDTGSFGSGYVRMWVEEGVLKTERVDPRTIASKPAPEETARQSLLARLKTTLSGHVMARLFERNVVAEKPGAFAARVAQEAVEAVFDALGVKTIQAVEFDCERAENLAPASLRLKLLANYGQEMVHSEPSQAETGPNVVGTELHTFAITKLPEGYNKGSAR